MILYLRSCNHILKGSVPCSKGGLEGAPQAKGNLGRSVLQLTAALTFQHEVEEANSDPALLLAKIKSELSESPAEGVSGTVTCGRERDE